MQCSDCSDTWNKCIASANRNQSITISHFISFIYIQQALEYYKPPSTTVAGIWFPKLIHSSSYSQWVMVYYSISSSIDFRGSISRKRCYSVQLSKSQFGPMFEIQKELVYCSVFKCMNSLKKKLLLVLIKRLIILQSANEVGRELVLQYFIALQKTMLHALQLVCRLICIPCAVFSSGLELIQNFKEKSKS